MEVLHRFTAKHIEQHFFTLFAKPLGELARLTQHLAENAPARPRSAEKITTAARFGFSASNSSGWSTLE